MKSLSTVITESILEAHQNAEQALWKFMDELHYTDLLKKWKGYKDNSIIDAIKDLLISKVDAGEYTPELVKSMYERYQGLSSKLSDICYDSWEDDYSDACNDIACGIVAMGKKTYDKCLADPSSDFTKSMPEATKRFESPIYAFIDVVEKYFPKYFK